MCAHTHTHTHTHTFTHVCMHTHKFTQSLIAFSRDFFKEEQHMLKLASNLYNAVLSADCCLAVIPEFVKYYFGENNSLHLQVTAKYVLRKTKTERRWNKLLLIHFSSDWKNLLPYVTIYEFSLCCSQVYLPQMFSLIMFTKSSTLMDTVRKKIKRMLKTDLAVIPQKHMIIGARTTPEGWLSSAPGGKRSGSSQAIRACLRLSGSPTHLPLAL